MRLIDEVVVRRRFAQYAPMASSKGWLRRSVTQFMFVSHGAMYAFSSGSHRWISVAVATMASVITPKTK